MLASSEWLPCRELEGNRPGSEKKSSGPEDRKVREGGMAKANAAGGWLFKQEPGSYSFGDLERDGMTLWDGVTNALALKNMRNIRVGDRVLFYHTGKEKAVV